MKNREKGFTLVELVIVIAIVTILAAATVSAYTAIVEKARLSNDRVNIESINRILAALSIPEKPATAGDAIRMLYSEGIYGTRLRAYSEGHKYAYDLANNRLCLVDPNGAAVYPERTDTDQLWALYNDSPDDKIPHFRNYVATGAVCNQRALDAVFTPELSYTFDLQRSGFLNGTVQNHVTVVHGIVRSEAAVNAGIGVTQMDALTLRSNAAGTYEQKIVTFTRGSQNTSATFRNCVIVIGTLSNRPTVSGAIFENCTFVSSIGGNLTWALETNGALTVRNCTFLNNACGIAIQSYSGAVVLENNRFLLTDASPDANAIHLSGSRTAAVTDAFSLTVRGNIFENCNAVVCIHKALAPNGFCAAVDEAYLQGKVHFEKNTFGNLSGGKCVHESDYQGSGLTALSEWFDRVVS